MRTTLDIDDDVLRAAKEVARREKRTAGEVISSLARRGLAAHDEPPRSRRKPRQATCGFRPFASRGVIVTDEVVDSLREGGPY